MSESEQKPTEVRVRKKMVFVGVKPGSSMPKVYEWYELDGNENLLPDGKGVHIYGPVKKKRRGHTDYISNASVGQIFSFDFPADNNEQVYSSTGRYEGRWENKEQAAEWAAESRAIEAEIDLQLRAKKERKAPDFEGLEPIRKAYSKLPPVHQRLLLAEVVAYIARPWRGD